MLKIIVGQRGCLLSKETDLGLAQSRFYALVDKTSLSKTNGSFTEVKTFKSVSEVAHSNIFWPQIEVERKNTTVGQKAGVI